MLCIKIDKLQVVYRFWECYVFTAVITSHIFGKVLVFSSKKCDFKVILYDE